VGGHLNHHLRGTRRGRRPPIRPPEWGPNGGSSEEAVPTRAEVAEKDLPTITNRVHRPADSTDIGVVCAVPLCH
jgi:hypothetical protein